MTDILKNGQCWKLLGNPRVSYIPVELFTLRDNSGFSSNGKLTKGQRLNGGVISVDHVRNINNKVINDWKLKDKNWKKPVFWHYYLFLQESDCLLNYQFTLAKRRMCLNRRLSNCTSPHQQTVDTVNRACRTGVLNMRDDTRYRGSNRV